MLGRLCHPFRRPRLASRRGKFKRYGSVRRLLFVQTWLVSSRHAFRGDALALRREREWEQCCSCSSTVELRVFARWCRSQRVSCAGGPCWTRLCRRRGRLTSPRIGLHCRRKSDATRRCESRWRVPNERALHGCHASSANGVGRFLQLRCWWGFTWA